MAPSTFGEGKGPGIREGVQMAILSGDQIQTICGLPLVSKEWYET